MLMDEKGELVDGDQIMAICGTYMKQKRYLKKEYDRCYCYDKPWIFTDGRTRRHPCGKDKSWRQICS